jgi:hypothetical protein
MNKHIYSDWEFPFTLLGKTWIMYLPGYEGLYAVSEDFNLLRLAHSTITADDKLRNYNSRILNKNKSYGYAIQKDGKYEIFSKKKLISIVKENLK